MSEDDGVHRNHGVMLLAVVFKCQGQLWYKDIEFNWPAASGKIKIPIIEFYSMMWEYLHRSASPI